LKLLTIFIKKQLKKLNQKKTNTQQNVNKKKLNVIDLIATNKIDSFIRDGNFRKEIGEELVQVISYCPEHKKYHHKIFYDDIFQQNKKNNSYPKLSTAITHGLLNEGCICLITTYYPELKNIKFNKNGYPTKNTLKQYNKDMKWIEKNIHKIK